jgi:hypothetical protein
LLPTDYVLSADEKPPFKQARVSITPYQLSPESPCGLKRIPPPRRLVYLAAWDVHRAKVFGRCELENGIGPFDRLVAEVMAQEPYRSATRSSGLWMIVRFIGV